jgi:hypothetical protein
VGSPSDVVSGLNLTKEQWKGALKLASMWEMDEVRCFFFPLRLGAEVSVKIRRIVIDKLSAMTLGALEKIALAKAYRVLTWMSEGIEALPKEFEKHSIEEVASIIGWDKAARVSDAISRTRGAEMADSIHKSRVTCYDCKMAIKSSQQSDCTCGSRVKGNYAFRIAATQVERPIVPLDAMRRIFADYLDDLKGL